MKHQPQPALPTLASILVLALVLAPLLAAQTGEPGAAPPPRDEVTLMITGQERPLVRLAFPDLDRAGLARSFDFPARELEATLRSDLDFAGSFDIQGPWAFAGVELVGDRARDHEQYRALGNEYLLEGAVESEGANLVFVGRLWDLGGGEPLLAKRYRGEPAAARRIAHSFADEVVRALTGRRGVATTRIAIASDRSGHKEIYLVDYDGANPTPVTAHRSTSLSPAWARDGGGLAYVSFFAGYPGIYLATFPSGRKSPLVTEGRLNISPAFSPDGRRVAFARALGGNTEIFVADRNGGDERRLTFSNAIDTNPVWSPNGDQIAFTSSRAGNPHIYVMDAEGANLRRVSFEGTYNDGASWSPSGDFLAYASRRGGTFQIALTNLVTLETNLVTSGRGSKEDPSFAPDSRHLAYTSSEAGGKQIFIVGIDGSRPRQITAEGNNESPAWGPFDAR